MGRMVWAAEEREEGEGGERREGEGRGGRGRGRRENEESERDRDAVESTQNRKTGWSQNTRSALCDRCVQSRGGGRGS